MKTLAQLKTTSLMVALLAAQGLRAAEIPVPDVKPSVPPTEMPTPDIKLPELKLPPDAQLPESVRGLAASFRSQSQQYVDRQKRLSLQAETASAADRERIREQIKANRAQFLQQTRQIRSEIKDRIREVHRSIGNSRPLDGAAAERGAGARRRR